MLLRQHFKESLLNLTAAKLRTFLAMLGILVGTASIVAMVSSGELATQQALRQFKTLGTNLLSLNISMQPTAGTGANQLKLDLADLYRLKQASSNIGQLAPYTVGYNAVTFAGKNLNATIVGVTNALQPIIRIKMATGRFISDLDNYQFYAVVGFAIAKQLKSQIFGKLIGRQIRIGEDIFTIVGVTKHWPENGFFYQNINNAILLPIKTSMLISKYSRINNIVFYLKDDKKIAPVKTAITKYFRDLSPSYKLFFRSAQQIVTSMKKQSEIFTLMLGFIGSISLIVAGIGVMNIMLVSVIERRREIGIRKAIGAKRKDIQLMFLIEAVSLSLCGGVFGVVVGLIASYIIALISKWQFMFLLLPPSIGFAVSVFIGVFFGFYPALKASKLDPIQTLRSE